MMNMQTPMGVIAVPEPMPNRVQAAFQVLNWAFNIERGAMTDMGPRGARDLVASENAVYRQALHVINQYLSGEMDFGDAPPRPAVCADGDEPPLSPVPRVPV